jgi:uncharacterized cupin superfamily protein
VRNIRTLHLADYRREAAMTYADDVPKPPAICRPIAAESVPWKQWGEGTRFLSRYRHLTTAAAGPAYHVGVEIDELPPGKQSAPAHYHMLEEEHLFVLEGGCTLRLGDERHELRAGDYVCFPAGQAVGHCLINEGAAMCRLLVIGERSPHEVCVYTDSNKVLVRNLGEIYDKRAVRKYWDGEMTTES